MWTLWFWGVLASLCIGTAAKFGFDKLRIRNDVTSTDYDSTFSISWIEFVIVFLLSALVIIPITTKVGETLAKQSKLTYHEFWGGYETAAVKDTQGCTRDGPCQDTYHCDPYVVSETYTTSDAKGHITVHTRLVTKYHDCPVATVENYYSIKTTVGKFDLGMAFDANPVAWRDSHGLDNTRRGDLPMWLAAKQRIDAGTPGPATADKTYDNYILASTRTILHKYSDAVKRYTAAKQLPYPTHPLNNPIHDYYYADKFSTVAFAADENAWDFALARLNAALGAGLQGDLHVVAVNASVITNPDEYAGALESYWQSPALGRRALSKNGIGLVLGVTGDKITWSRAFTGMPVGNDGLTLDLQDNLTNQTFSPAIFGSPVGHIEPDGKHVTVTTTASPVERALWGPHKFQRVCMLCHTKGDKGVGFGYLSSEIQPSSGQRILIILMGVFLSCILWATALFTVIGEHHPKRSGRSWA